MCGTGDDRLQQKGRSFRYDSLCCLAFRGDFDPADAAKRADNLAGGARGLGWTTAQQGERPAEVCVGENERAGLHEEGLHRMLERGDRAMDFGEYGLEMGEDLRGRQAPWFRGRPGRRLRGRSASTQRRADRALRPVEALPDALPAPSAEAAVDVPAGGQDVGGDGELEELPQSVGSQAEASDFVGEPDAESPPATGPCIAVAAENAAGPHRFLSRATLVIAAQKAVQNQGAHTFAMRARRLLEPLRDRHPFLGVAVKPACLIHGTYLPKMLIL